MADGQVHDDGQMGGFDPEDDREDDLDHQINLDEASPIYDEYDGRHRAGHHGRGHHHGHHHGKWFHKAHRAFRHVKCWAKHHKLAAGLIAALALVVMLGMCRLCCLCCRRRSERSARRYLVFSEMSGRAHEKAAPPSYEASADADLDAAIAASLAESTPPAYTEGVLPSAIVQGQVAV